MLIEKNMKQGDLGPILKAQITKKSNQEPVDLTGATALFKMYQINDDSSTTELVNDTADIAEPTTGIVSYSWQAGDTDIIGEHQAFFEITFTTGVETFPSKGAIFINIESVIQ